MMTTTKKAPIATKASNASSRAQRNHNREFKYGIFDKDGVLIDSIEKYHAFFNDALNRHFGQTITLQYYKDIATKNWLEVLLPITKTTEALMKCVDDYHEITASRAAELSMYNGVPELLDGLKHSHGLRMFVTSSSFQKAVDETLKHTGLAGPVELAIGNNGKKSVRKEEHFQLFADHVQLSLDEFAKHAFILEDMAHGIEAAIKVGIYAIGITTTLSRAELKAAGADEVIDRHEELLDII